MVLPDRWRHDFWPAVFIWLSGSEAGVANPYRRSFVMQFLYLLVSDLPEIFLSMPVRTILAAIEKNNGMFLQSCPCYPRFGFFCRDLFQAIRAALFF
jgi:hypothetical protein